MANPYDVLGVHPDADEEVVKAVYQALVKKHHPDQGGDQEEFQRIKEAYDQIEDSTGTKQQRQDRDAAFEGFADSILGLSTPVTSETIRGRLSDDLSIHQGPVQVSLLGFFRTDITDLVWEHKRDSANTSNRFLALFHIENTSEYVQKWQGSAETKYVGTDGYNYESMQNSFLATEQYSPLPAQYSVDFVDMEPGTQTLGVVAPEEIPIGVDVDRVIYSQNVFEGDQTDGWVQHKYRFVFDITPETRKQMRALVASPFEPAGEIDAKPKDTPNADVSADEESLSPDGDLSDTDRRRLQDILRLEPTSNKELASEWNLESGKQVYQYLSTTLDEYYYRDDEKRIRATESASEILS
ncbi:DUF5797 family protein [Halopenitus salinus]|uniref:DUF5797 family protein n=1 Tax=Halopenitus salinus TaxID=1198295 RepID=A0ABD5USA1_9EURY